MQLIKRLRPFPALLLLFTILTACSTNRTLLTAQRPPDVPFENELHQELSSIRVSFETSAVELARVLNQTVGRELYRGPVKNSGITATIRRNGQIGTAMSDNYIHITLPVTLSLAYGMFKVPDISIKLKFRVQPAITPDWKITADVQYTGLEELFADQVTIGPFSIKPLTILEGTIRPLQKTLSTLVSKQLYEQFPLKKRLESAWAAMQNPILLGGKYTAWLKLTPKEVMLTPLQTERNRAKLIMGLNTLAEVTIGPEPPHDRPSPLPQLQRINRLDKDFRLSVKSNLFYREIVAILSPLLVGRDFGTDGNSVILKNLDLYGNGDRIIVRLETTGSLSGTFYLVGKPNFNPQTNLFSVEELDFDMNTESLLLTSANWFLHGSIRERLQEKLNLDISKRIADARTTAQSSLSNIELAKHVYLQGNIGRVKFKKVLVQKDRISIHLCAEGETTMVLK
ncbi:MAG TPA: DUF4403 family protein [Geobacteraceae bacterium]|nr:DUF4403 family protein [Geobacteraceae bacterium]